MSAMSKQGLATLLKYPRFISSSMTGVMKTLLQNLHVRNQIIINHTFHMSPEVNVERFYVWKSHAAVPPRPIHIPGKVKFREVYIGILKWAPCIAYVL